MSAHAYAAVARLAVVRGRTGLIVALALVTVGALGAALLPGWMSMFAGVAGLVSLLITTVSVPLSSLAREKMLGQLDFDRTLPVPLRTIAAGRLSGAALRTLPVAIGLAGIGIALVAQSPEWKQWSLVVALLLALLAYWSSLWISYALIARFPMRRLMWIPGLIWIGLVVMPPALEDAIGERASAAADVLFRQANPSAGALLLIVAGAVVLTAVAFAGANAILVSALARFEPDPTAMLGVHEAAPKRELMAAGRGPVFAVARLRLRLAAATVRREVIFAGVAVFVLVADIGPLTELARIYLPILAAMIPGVVAIQLSQARVTGTLESLQQLPIPHRSVALGHVLAVMVLAIPSVVIIAVARATDALEPDVSLTILLWFLIAAAGSAAAAFVVWGTKRRLAALLLIGFATPIALAMLAAWLSNVTGVPLRERIDATVAWWATVGPLGVTAIAVVVAMGAVAIAIEVFARGLSGYQAPAVN